ncbi:response regulator [Candidatus Parcubacteria bacterium]|nr:response regulator [Candidatus Parcubacteria bacterium]
MSKKVFIMKNEKSSQVEEEISKEIGIRVLLVEDDDFLRDICEIKLKKEGFNVTTSADGIDAFKKIKDIKPQLVLLDVILPGMDGFDILKQTKENVETTLIPIIMLTNLGQNDEVQKGLDMGAEDYIIKAHFTVDEIVEKVRSIIKKNKIK